MAIKIPRYTSSLGSAPVSSGRSITTGVVDNPVGEGMMNLVRAFGDAQIKREAKLRDIDLTTKNEQGKNDSLLFNDNFLEGLNERSDWDTWEADYEEKWLEQETTKKDNIFASDDIAWKKHEPFHDLAYIEGLRAVRQKKNEIRLKMAEREYGVTYQNVQHSIDNATSPNAVLSAYETWKTSTLDSYKKTEFFDAGRYQTDLEGMKNYANSAYLYQQTSKGVSNIMSPDKVEAVDWAGLATKAADPNFSITDIDGNELTVDDPIRKGLVKQYRDKASEQKTFFDNRNTALDRDVSISFADRLINMAQGNPDDKFLEDLKKSRLSDTDKVKYKNSYATTLSNLSSGTKLYDTPQGMQTNSTLRIMISAGLIDTEQEKQVIYDMGMSGLISPESVTTLTELVDKKQRDINAPKALLYKRAVSTIMKEMGEKPSILNMINGQTGVASVDDARSLIDSLSGTMSYETALAIQNLDKVLAIGEAKGFTVENMLANEKSNNYVLGDLIKVYKGAADDASITKFQQKANEYMNATKDFEGYRIDGAAWAQSGLRDAPIVQNVPLREDNESISNYLIRLDNWNKTQQTGFGTIPSFLRGDVMGSGSAATINLTGTE